MLAWLLWSFAGDLLTYPPQLTTIIRNYETQTAWNTPHPFSRTLPLQVTQASLNGTSSGSSPTNLGRFWVSGRLCQAWISPPKKEKQKSPLEHPNICTDDSNSAADIPTRSSGDGNRVCSDQCLFALEHELVTSDVRVACPAASSGNLLFT